MLYIQLAWRNLWRNRRRTIITVAAVFFAGFAVITMRVMQLGTYDLMVNNIIGENLGFIQVHQKGYWDERTFENSFESSEELLDEILTVPGVTGVSPRLSGGSLVSEGMRTRGVLVDGFDPIREVQYDFHKKVKSGDINPDGGVLLGAELANYLKVDVGDSIVFIGQGYHGMSANGLLPVAGIVNIANPELSRRSVYMSLENAQYMYAMEGRLTALAINIDPSYSLAEVKAGIQGVIDTSEYEVMDWQEMMPELVQTIQADSAGGILMAGILYIVISFSLFGTFIMLAAERKREYGMLIGLGMRRSQLMRVSFYEAGFMALLGAVFATVITRPIALYFHANPIQLSGQALDAMKEMGIEAEMPFSIDWSIPLTHSAILFVLTILISVYGLWVIKKIDPVTAMRS